MTAAPDDDARSPPDAAEQEVHPSGGRGTAPERRKWRRVAGTVAKAVAGIVAFLVAATGLLFAIDPGARPCLSGTDAMFTGAPVFPGISYVRYIEDLGYSPTRAERRYGSGYEVRYSMHTDGLRGHALYLYTTLVRLNRDGTIEHVVPGQDLMPRLEDTPNACAWTEGSAFWVRRTLQRNGHYRFVLELYEGPSFHTRVALTETPTFDG